MSTSVVWVVLFIEVLFDDVSFEVPMSSSVPDELKRQAVCVMRNRRDAAKIARVFETG